MASTWSCVTIVAAQAAETTIGFTGPHPLARANVRETAMQSTSDNPLALNTRAEIDNFVADSADFVSRLHRQTTGNILQIGQRLATVKELLGHGAFGRWVTSECSFSSRTALRYMSAARAFGEKSDTVSEISISVVHALSSPKVSDETRESVLAAVKEGAETSAGAVRARLAKLDTPFAEVVPPKLAPMAARKKLKAERALAAARKTVAGIMIKASSGSAEQALKLAEKAMLPDLQAVLNEVKASIEQQQAEFNARQFPLPFGPLEHFSRKDTGGGPEAKVT